MWWLAGCPEPDETSVRGGAQETAIRESTSQGTGPPGDTTETDTETETGPRPRVDPAAPTHVALPFVEVGGAVPEGTFVLTAGSEGHGGVEIAVDGPFTATVAADPLAPLEEREVTVRWDGDPSAPANGVGRITLTLDDVVRTTTVAAVVGAVGLGEASWTEDLWGRRVTVGLPSAPYPYGGAPYTDDSVLIALPAGIADREGVGAIVHLHGHNAILDETVAAKHLVEQHTLSGRDAVLIVPQGPYDAADSDFGRLEQPGAFADLLRDAFAVLYRDGATTWPVPGDAVVTAHSGGYHGAAAIVRDGGHPPIGVHLFDALYAESSTFEDVARSGLVFRSVYTSSGGTSDENVALRALPITIGASDDTHDGCVWEERAFARWLTASGLRRHPGAAPELLTALAGADLTLTWRPDGDTRWDVEGSADGATWERIGESSGSSVTVPSRPWVRVRAADLGFGPGAPSDTWAGSGGDWLLVDGFDRVLDGSWTAPTHDFAARLGAALGGASTASNEAVAEGLDLGPWDRILWFLGDESTSDTVFAAAEQAALTAFLDRGGRLIVTGSEVGYAGGSFVEEVLGARYVKDDAGTDRVEGWTFGVVYDEDWPDVLAGDETIWRYDTGDAAAVRHDSVIVVGFPLETMDDATLDAAVDDLVAALE